MNIPESVLIPEIRWSETLCEWCWWHPSAARVRRLYERARRTDGGLLAEGSPFMEAIEWTDEAMTASEMRARWRAAWAIAQPIEHRIHAEAREEELAEDGADEDDDPTKQPVAEWRAEVTARWNGYSATVDQIMQEIDALSDWEFALWAVVFLDHSCSMLVPVA